MFTKRKTLGASLAVGILLTPLALLVPSAQAAEAAKTITVATWGSSPAETAALDDAIATFEVRYPLINVDRIVHTDHGAQMAAKFAAKTPPDVFYLDWGVAQDWISQGVLHDLTPNIAASNFDLTPFNKSYLKPFQAKGGIYGLPKDANPLTLEGNKTLMAKAKITALPKTIKEFDVHAKMLLAKKITPMCVDADLNRLGAYFVSFGGGISNAAWTTSLLQSKETKAAMDWIMKNYKSGAFKTPAQLSSGWAGEAFGKAKCAYTMEGAWLDPFLRDSFPDVYKTMIKGSLPTAAHTGSLAFTAAYAIGKDTANKSDAWTFIQYMTGSRGMTIWTSQGVALPSRSDVPTPLGYEANGIVAKDKYTVSPPAIIGWSKVIDAFNNKAKASIQDKNFDPKKAASAILSAAQAAWPAG